jgi:hypothetical protein
MALGPFIRDVAGRWPMIIEPADRRVGPSPAVRLRQRRRRHQRVQPEGSQPGRHRPGHGADLSPERRRHRHRDQPSRATAQVPILASAQPDDVGGQVSLGRHRCMFDQHRDHPDTGGERFGESAADPVGRVVDPAPAAGVGAGQPVGVRSLPAVPAQITPGPATPRQTQGRPGSTHSPGTHDPRRSRRDRNSAGDHR